MPSKTKYLYLAEKGWVKTWIEGGSIPIKLASSYKSDIRDKTLTPDENLQRNLKGVAEADFKKLGYIGDKASAKIVIDGKVIIGGEEKGENVEFNQFYEDGLILSFCNLLDPEIAAKLGKKACVEIPDIDELLDQINKQVGITGIAKECTYTNTFERNHFLKSVEDQWQNEFRLFWPYHESVNVTIAEKYWKRSIAKYLIHIQC